MCRISTLTFACGHIEEHIEECQERSERRARAKKSIWGKVKKWMNTCSKTREELWSRVICGDCFDEMAYSQPTNPPRPTAEEAEEEAVEQEGRIDPDGEHPLGSIQRRAPPARGQSETIAAVALRGDDIAIQNLRKAQASVTDQIKSAAVSSDLERVIRFWEDNHNNHFPEIVPDLQAVCSVGPENCPQCLEIKLLLTQPTTGDKRLLVIDICCS